MSDAGSSNSSEAWSNSEGEQSADDAGEIAPPSFSARKQHGEKRAYTAPKGYVTSNLPSDILSAFGADSFSKGTRKELWCIKIPDGISPAQLDGLTIDMPDRTASSSSRIALAQIEIDRQGKAAGASTFKQHYTLCVRRSDSTKSGEVRDDGLSQLIAMAEGTQKKVEEGSKGDADGNDEMQSLLVLLPDSRKPGRYVRTPMPLQYHMQLVLNTPTSSDEKRSATRQVKSNDGDEEKSVIRPQPWSKMKGYFSPAGSQAEADKGTVGAIAQQEASIEDANSPKKRSKKEKVDAASPKKSKKVKPSS